MDSGSEEESVLDVGEEQLFEEDLEVDEFAETLKLIESNAEEIDQQLLDAISEVEGAKHFQCPDCPKVCKSKGGLTRHRRSKHPDKEELTVATINIPPINMEIIAKIISETVEKLREENIYPKEILDIISKLKPSESFLKFITKVFRLFCRKLNQDRMLALFYGEIIKDWRVYFPPCDNQKAINILLIHLPQKLVVYHKQLASNKQRDDQGEDEIGLKPEEIGPLSYVTGYVLQSLYRKSKNSKHWNSPRSQELQFLLQSLKLEETKEDQYIQSLSRGGRWTPNETIKNIAKTTELMFRQHLKLNKSASVPTDKVVDQ
ncbi:hypothetical protein AWC38_SpisGene12476, partial [Paramuricea clavata]